MLPMVKTKLGEWLEQQYVTWQARQGGRRTIDAFAQYVGVSRVAINRWMNGTRTPDAEYADLIAEKLGPEIYDLLDIPRPDPRLQAIIRQWGNLPEYIKDDLLKRAEQDNGNNGANGGHQTDATNSAVAPAKRKQKT